MKPVVGAGPLMNPKQATAVQEMIWERTECLTPEAQHLAKFRTGVLTEHRASLGYPIDPRKLTYPMSRRRFFLFFYSGRRCGLER